ncbi:MAG: hypothetical protein KKG75_01440 [Nanoarchaeota archaeon]|nr:hypothetical protein [Nanoarchaeota archaeon]
MKKTILLGLLILILISGCGDNQEQITSNVIKENPNYQTNTQEEAEKTAQLLREALGLQE